MRNFRRIAGALSSAGLLGATFTLAAGAGAGTIATAAPAIFHAPRVPNPGHPLTNTWAASNWSGYAETGTFAGISGTWTVPSVAASSSPTYSSAWIGVDGFNNNDLIQTGTEEDYYNGAAHYNAWWEILPAPETALPGGHAVYPGDTMTASIYKTTTQTAGPPVHGRGHGGGGGGGGFSQSQWVINISDTTPGHAWQFSTTQSYNGPGSSAEWVMEAPEVGGRIATLAHYSITPAAAGAGDFDNAGILKSAVASGSSPTYTSAGLNYNNDAGVMIQNGAQVSTPGQPDIANNAFNVAYGSLAPGQPNS